MSPLRPRSNRVATGVVFGLALVFLAWPAEVRPQTDVRPASVAWQDDLGRAHTAARSRDRLLWLQFTGPWCHNCDRMERESFTHPRVAAASADFVAVKLRSDEHEELALSYGLSSLPATVVLRPDGGLVASAQGYRDPETFSQFLRDSLARAGRSGAVERHVGGRPALPNRGANAPALAGFCPVSLVESHRLVAGRSSLTAEEAGRLYRFADAGKRDRFLSQPALFAPVNAGLSPVAQVDLGESRPGSPKWGVLYEGHLFLCGDEAERKQFLRRPGRYTRVVDAERTLCPHCRAVESLATSPDLRQNLTRSAPSATPQGSRLLHAARPSRDTSVR